MPSNEYFFDVPVYRIEERRYYAERDQWIDRILFPPNNPYSSVRREKELQDPKSLVGPRDHMQRSFDGCWRYNEIIGYIRLHFLGSQIRGEYYGVQNKRIVRTRKKILEYQTWKLAPEIEIPPDSKSEEIFGLIVEYVNDCRKELKGRRFVDSEILETIGPYIDWRAFWIASIR